MSQDDPDGGVEESADSAPPLRQFRVAKTGGDGLNLRDASSTSADVLALMPEGAVVDVFSGPTDGWYGVIYEKIDGFASADYLLEVSDAELSGEGGLLNLLPWEANVKYRVSRAHGDTGGHTGDSYWAWDFAMPKGTSVLAAHNGTVRLAQGKNTKGCCDPSCGKYANYVVVDRGDGTESLYLHLSVASVKAGDYVTRGQEVGRSGETGYACGAHLHFQMQKSPSGGGTTYRYNKTVSDVFLDTGEELDPKPGTSPVSKNGVLDIP